MFRKICIKERGDIPLAGHMPEAEECPFACRGDSEEELSDAEKRKRNK